MSLEQGELISNLVSANPLGTDPKSQGDDHLRLIKAVIKGDAAAKSEVNTFTATQFFSGDVTINGNLLVSSLVAGEELARTIGGLTVLQNTSFSSLVVSASATISSVTVLAGLLFGGKLTLPALAVTSDITASSVTVLTNVRASSVAVAGAASFSTFTIQGQPPLTVAAWGQLRISASATMAAGNNIGLNTFGLTYVNQLGTGIFRIGVIPINSTATTYAFVANCKGTNNHLTETALGALHAVHSGASSVGILFDIIVKRTAGASTARDPSRLSFMFVK